MNPDRETMLKILRELRDSLGITETFVPMGGAIDAYPHLQRAFKAYGVYRMGFPEKRVESMPPK